MKHSHFTILTSSLLALAMCVALPACKKKDAAAPAAEAAKPADAPKADAAQAEAKAADAKAADAKAAAPAAPKADADVGGAVKYAKAANLSLFADGETLHFSVKSDLENNTDLEGTPGWNCDEENCTANFEYDIECTVKRIANDANYCISELKCAVEGGGKMASVFPNGLWGIDSHGVHYSNNSDLMRREKPGCEDCKAGTMRYDYENFDDEEWESIDFDDMTEWLVLFENVSPAEDSGEDDEEGDAEGCSKSGSIWKCANGEMAGYTFVWDEQRGIVKFVANYIEGDEMRDIELNAK